MLLHFLMILLGHLVQKCRVGAEGRRRLGGQSAGKHRHDESEGDTSGRAKGEVRRILHELNTSIV